VKEGKKILTVIGARPQIIKSSAISRAIRLYFSDTLHEVIVHTGQHYDANMSDVFFQELELSIPQYNLHIGSASHGVQTARMMEGIENICIKETPDCVLVYGDTNSTLSASLVASKLQIPLLHIEAGLRSFDKTMPEEINRIVCDHLSTLLFVPTQQAIKNLYNEGFLFDQQQKISINNPKILHCGDIMYDNSMFFSSISEKKSLFCKENNLQKDQFILCTIHRPINTDSIARLSNIIDALLLIQRIYNKKIVFPVHPRTKNKLKNIDNFSKIEANSSFIVTDPVGFLDMIDLEKKASLIITDSGGVQKESFFFKTPCLVLRNETEWIELIENENAILVDANTQKIIDGFHKLSNKTDFTYPQFYGDGKTASFICKQILTYLN